MLQARRGQAAAVMDHHQSRVTSHKQKRLMRLPLCARALPAGWAGSVPREQKRDRALRDFLYRVLCLHGAKSFFAGFGAWVHCDIFERVAKGCIATRQPGLVSAVRGVIVASCGALSDIAGHSWGGKGLFSPSSRSVVDLLAKHLSLASLLSSLPVVYSGFLCDCWSTKGPDHHDHHVRPGVDGLWCTY